MRSFVCALFIAFGIYSHRVSTKVKESKMEQETLQKQLQNALTKVLGGFPPAQCKKIRDDRGDWIPIEPYVRDHTDADLSHTLCSECLRELYPDYEKS